MTRIAPPILPAYRSILLAVDASDHSNRATEEAAALARLYEAQVTGVHVYAAKLHDVRFRQMEGGLPEQYRQEEELERQRDVHDDLITRGLSTITDSYLDRAEEVCQRQTVRFARRSLEGKNYRELVSEANNGSGYDLLVLGSRGLGAVGDTYLGTVCQRVTRRTAIDTLVIKEPQRGLSKGPIVVATDGSDRSYGGLLTTLFLAKRWEVPVEVVAAYDPHYHYVAFNRIAGMLSDKASQEFRFKEQEKLHEEIIDSGIARIYESHLKMAEAVAESVGIQTKTTLLEGKPHHAIEEYVRAVNASLLVIGKLGVHADDDLDIGGNAELLLRGAPCAVLLSQRTYRPPLDELAEITTSWSEEAERKMERVPAMVRKMARIAILRYAQERGHTVITGKIVEEVTELMCPVETPMTNSAREPAEQPSAADPAGREGTGQSDAPSATEQADPIHWSVEALARLARIPAGFMRNASRERVERYAHEVGADEVTPEVAEQGLAQARQAMEEALGESGAHAPRQEARHTERDGYSGPDVLAEEPIPWTDEAEQALLRVPEGFMRDLTRRRVEAFAHRKGKTEVSKAVMDAKYSEWGEGSATQKSELTWEDDAREHTQRIPEFVRGMVIKEVERCAREMHAETVGLKMLKQACNAWQKHGIFHSETNSQQYSRETEPLSRPMGHPEYTVEDFGRNPLMCYYEVTQACDLVCAHCRASAQENPHPEELTTDQSKALIEQIATFPRRPILVMTGGDPLKRAGLFDLIRHARANGLEVALTPSATPLATREAFEAAKDAGVRRLGISLDGPDAKTHDAFRGWEGSFDRTLQMLDNSRQLGLGVQINTTITRRNFNKIDEMAELLSARGISMWSVFFLVPVGRGVEEQRISPYDYEIVFERLWHHAQHQPFGVKTTEAPHYRRYVLQRGGDPLARPSQGKGHAHAARGHGHRAPLGVWDGKGVMFISHTGEIYPAGFLPTVCGQFPEDSVVDVYQNHPTFVSLRDPDQFVGKCGTCDYRDVCGGSRARAYTVTGNYLESEPDCVYLPTPDSESTVNITPSGEFGSTPM